ncbi:MAG: hypothetical protein K6A31_01330 [Fibrobacter sp.]|nr:hypothetical protein [Fibrobacter sp.]
MKILFFLTIIAFTLIGCSSSHLFTEKWIDDDVVASLRTNQKWSTIHKRLGAAVVTELHQDTTEYIYSFRSHLYESGKDGSIFMPTDKDRVNIYNNIPTYIGIVVLNDRIIQVRLRPDIQNRTNLRTVESSSVSWGTILGLITAAGCLFAALILLN